MAEVNQEVVRLFFEGKGFFVQSNVQFPIASGRGRAQGDIDLLVANTDMPSGLRGMIPGRFVLQEDDVSGIGRAIVDVKGWHGRYFSPATIIEHAGDILFGPEALQKAAEILGTDQFDRILVVSRMSPDPDQRGQAEEILRQGGVDYVIEFGTIVNFLWFNVEENGGYAPRTLQTMSLIKKYVF